MFKKFNYFNKFLASSPFDTIIKLRKNTGKSVLRYLHSQIISSLLHLANHTILDIAYAIGRLGRHTYNPSTAH